MTAVWSRTGYKLWKNRSRILVLAVAAACAGGCGKQEQDQTQGSGTGEQEQTFDSGTGEQEQVLSFWDLHTREEMIGRDYLLYSVNCGGTEAGELGLYQSCADQEYGEDKTTGRRWGYQPSSYIEAVEDDEGEGLSASRWEIKEGTDYNNEETGFYYDFEVPAGEYEVTLGFFNPFSARTVCVDLEGNREVDSLKILKYKLTEAAAVTEVADGTLQVKVYNPERGTDAMKDPILSYIVVRAVPEYDSELLDLYLEETEVPEEYADRFTQNSYQAYQEKRQAALDLSGKEGSAEQYREACVGLMEAYNDLKEVKVYGSFLVGKRWTDDEGNLIQAHGGQVQRLPVRDEATGEMVEKWWWVGEDKSAGYRGGIRAYSSDDLYNWHFEGVVMRNVDSRQQLEEEDYFKELYGDYTSEQLDNVYTCLSSETAVIERPKMLYNEKTDMYVIWFHADGPTEYSDANYAAASAGVAVSASPSGPFRFIDRYRLNTCPPDQEDFYPESKGMARDMNLFVDTDGTAYIIYSSEENLTLYISKLNEEYTYLATDPEKAVYGVDFVRLFPGAQREAPALFLRDGGYYLLTSGCTGWAPNQARYYRADSVLGEWRECGDPCVGDTKMTTFDSQSTCVFLADEENNTYIYMGDRWNSEDLKNSRYIWLPVEFDEEGGMYLKYQEEWSMEDLVP